jgi:hypothetical protein
MAIITKEDVLDAIDDKNENALDLLTEYWQLQNEEDGKAKIVDNAIVCAQMLFSAKAYQETIDWLDAVGLDIAKTYGEESPEYEQFMENEELENMRMDALDKSSFEEEEEDLFGEDE